MSNRSGGAAASIIVFIVIGLFTMFPRSTTTAVVVASIALDKYIDALVEAQHGVLVMADYQTRFCPDPDQIELIIQNGSKSYLERIDNIYISGYVPGDAQPDYNRSYPFYDEITKVLAPGDVFRKCMWIPSKQDRTDRPTAPPATVEWIAGVGDSAKLADNYLDQFRYMRFLTDKQVATYMQ